MTIAVMSSLICISGLLNAQSRPSHMNHSSHKVLHCGRANLRHGYLGFGAQDLQNARHARLAESAEPKQIGLNPDGCAATRCNGIFITGRDTGGQDLQVLACSAALDTPISPSGCIALLAPVGQMKTGKSHLAPNSVILLSSLETSRKCLGCNFTFAK